MPCPMSAVLAVLLGHRDWQVSQVKTLNRALRLLARLRACLVAAKEAERVGTLRAETQVLTPAVVGVAAAMPL